MNTPGLLEEKKLWKKGFKVVAGLDEAGRGPLAGPVVAAAVSLIPNFKLRIRKLRDSKKLTPKKREQIYKLIIKSPDIKWGMGRISEKVIDKINILEATKLAMEKAINNLEKKKRKKVDFLLLDGKMKLGLPLLQKAIVKADEKVTSCALASIIAKVSRDRIMEKYHKISPQYGLNFNKGYPTNYHLKTLKKYGPCFSHRKSFAPVKKLTRIK